MIDIVKETIEKYKMINPGDKIVVGFSGGPDSLSLLNILNQLSDEYKIKLYAVHFNHMIRGEEAYRDENFARDFCKKNGIEFFCKRMEVLKYADENGMSCEEAGRFLRYKYFNEVFKKVGAQKIAIAHNMNDQAETVIMHFLRGAALTGLSGISPVRDEIYIRPLIFCTRDDIENYCREKKLTPVTDSTNSDVYYKRNRVRHEIIPYIKKYFNPAIIESLSRQAVIAKEDDDFLNREAERKLNELKSGDGYLVEDFCKLHNALKKRVMRLIIKNVKGNLNMIEAVHVEKCIEVIERRKTGKRFNLPYGIVLNVQYDIFKIEYKKQVLKYDYDLPIPGTITAEDINTVIETRIFENNSLNFKNTMFIKYFDYGKINNVLKLRNRLNGDFIYPSGMKGKKKLKDYFIDNKIPREDRDSVPLLACGSEILWIIGMRDSENFKIDEKTTNILEVKVKRRE